MRIRWCLKGFVLPCGCVGGTYETYAGDTVSIIDAQASGCGDASHADGSVLPVVPAGVEIPASEALHRRADPVSPRRE